MKPIIKWVGGKQNNLPYIRERLPVQFNTYYEPFCGGAAVLLDLNPTKAVVNDINPELINTYLVIRDQVEDLISCLAYLDTEHEVATDPKAFYYKVRSNFNQNLGIQCPQQAARFIYLNKHCFNGLYRVNKKGEFNVPFNGKLSGWSAAPDHLRELSTRLKNVDIRCGSFEDTVKDAGTNDFVFFDSPYAPITATSFTDYTKEGFDYEDHVTLAATFKLLTDRGCYCMLTNHDTPLIRELYKDFRIEVVDVRRSINRKGDGRTGKEVIITNYNPTGETFEPQIIDINQKGG
jgi:DNA adenine methylase